MNTMKGTQPCLASNAGALSIYHKKYPPNKKNYTVCFCSSGTNGSGSNSSSPSNGDKRRQEILARIAMLQAQKVRLTDFLDERSAYLTQYVEEANAEFDQIGENALKELDQASARILEKLESRMQTFEESAEVNRQEIERREKELEEFEEKIDKDRNEALFFKNLTDRKKPMKQAQARAEAQKIVEVTKRNVGSKTRRNVYLALISLLGIAIVNSVVFSPEVEWRRVAAFALILLALLTQYVYELNLSSKETSSNDEKK